jgi:hypothetical protein
MDHLKQERQELSLIGELMVELVMKGLTAAKISSILYEEYVRKLENDDDENQSELENIIDTISAFQKKHIWNSR